MGEVVRLVRAFWGLHNALRHGAGGLSWNAYSYKQLAGDKAWLRRMDYDQLYDLVRGYGDLDTVIIELRKRHLAEREEAQRQVA